MVNPSRPEFLIGEGFVLHRRPALSDVPGRTGKGVRNAFRYRTFNLLIPVHAKLVTNILSLRSWVSVHTKDYLDGKPGDLDQNVRDFLKAHLNYSCDQIWLQTMPRLFGYVFNPVSFWFCYRQGVLDSVLCEVNNTFGDRHFYFVRHHGGKLGFSERLEKVFHVSPFFDIAGEYRFNFALDDVRSEARIDLYRNQELQLETRLDLKLRPFDEASTFSLLLRYGWMTPMVVLRIHYQALKLWIKGAPFFRRPSPPESQVSSEDF